MATLLPRRLVTVLIIMTQLSAWSWLVTSQQNWKWL